MSLEQEIKDKGRELGFDAVGITDASPIGREHVEHLREWLRRGYAGPMDYMSRNLEERIDPAQLRKGARSAIVVALNYKIPDAASPRDSARAAGSDSESQISNLKSRIDFASDPAPAVGWAPPTASIASNRGVGTPRPESQISNLKSEIAPAKPPSAIMPLRGAQQRGTLDPQSAIGKVAAYAQYEDYHAFIKSLLRELASFVSVRAGRPDRYKICVDSAPLAEKALAVRAGLGFIARNHLLIHPHLGPQVLLGELLTTVPLQADEPNVATCQCCGLCMNACPTGALREDGFLDARRCISCLTQYPSAASPAPDTHGWLFGCDECLLACPFHQQAPPRANREFKFRPDRATLTLQEVLALDAGTFDAKFGDCPIDRLGLAPLQQTARSCLHARRVTGSESAGS
jgi:epoxyqueuosine reductase